MFVLSLYCPVDIVHSLEIMMCCHMATLTKSSLAGAFFLINFSNRILEMTSINIDFQF